MHPLIRLAIMAALTAVAAELLTQVATKLELVGIDAEFRQLTSGEI